MLIISEGSSQESLTVFHAFTGYNKIRARIPKYSSQMLKSQSAYDFGNKRAHGLFPGKPETPTEQSIREVWWDFGHDCTMLWSEVIKLRACRRGSNSCQWLPPACLVDDSVILATNLFFLSELSDSDELIFAAFFFLGGCHSLCLLPHSKCHTIDWKTNPPDLCNCYLRNFWLPFSFLKAETVLSDVGVEGKLGAFMACCS